MMAMIIPVAVVAPIAIIVVVTVATITRLGSQRRCTEDQGRESSKNPVVHDCLQIGPG
jgi:hypothetical protein